MSSDKRNPLSDANIIALDFVERAKANQAKKQARLVAKALSQSEDTRSPKLYINTVSKNIPSQPATDHESLNRILRLESENVFKLKTLRPGNEYPLLLTRLPIFMPCKKQTQKGMWDSNTAIEFSCSYGNGVRKGPAVSTVDEDVLMALMRLRQRSLLVPTNNKGAVTYDHLFVRVQDVVKMLGLSHGGPNFKRVVLSIKNLFAVTIELEQRLVDRYGSSFIKGNSIRFFSSLDWNLGEDDGYFEIVFDPLITHWLNNERTYVNWDTRLALKGLDTAKALHRYLSSQSDKHTIQLSKLASTIGHQGRANGMKSYIEAACLALNKVGFLSGHEWTGTGRAIPYSLTTYKA